MQTRNSTTAATDYNPRAERDDGEQAGITPIVVDVDALQVSLLPLRIVECGRIQPDAVAGPVREKTAERRCHLPSQRRTRRWSRRRTGRELARRSGLAVWPTATLRLARGRIAA